MSKSKKSTKAPDNIDIFPPELTAQEIKAVQRCALQIRKNRAMSELEGLLKEKEVGYFSKRGWIGLADEETYEEFKNHEHITGKLVKIELIAKAVEV